MISSWDDLRYLEALERLGSAAAAGRELDVAVSTVYRRIAALEQSVGFACLVRGRGITAAGSELARLARSTGTALTGIAWRAREQHEEVRGSVRLTTTDGFAPLLVEPLSTLAATYPHLRVDIHITDAGLSLRKHQADIGLTLLEAPPEILVGRKLFPIHFAVCGTRALADDPERARWITLAPPLHTSWLGRWESENVPADRVALATASRRLFVDLVVAGAGIGLLPTRLLGEHADLVELRGFAPRVAELTRSTWVLTHPDVRHDARVKAVMRVLGAKLRGSAP
jgi:DNA-binding transcriptional LysR family regulator